MMDESRVGCVADLALHRFAGLLFYGGSFDPPTRAHVELPERVRAEVGFDAVLYVPAAVSPFKTGVPPASAEHRVAMLRLALADRPTARIVLDEAEATGGAPSYTIDTVRAVRRAMRDGAELRLLLGGDQLAAFDRWREADALMELANPVVMLRPPQSRGSLLTSLPIDERKRWHHRIVEVGSMPVSSTSARDRLARGEPVDDALPEPVAVYAREHGLYR